MISRLLFLIVILFFTSSETYSQGFLRVDRQEIVNDNGPFMLRSIGTGNWMIQEGYMMQSTHVGVNTHTQFRNKLNETMGVDKTNEFYEAWLNNHFTKADLDSMKSWGFNAIRPALHYKWFTLPIEEETRTTGGHLTNTWLDKGFPMLDSLVKWCSANEMYVVFDMHGTPGGQGKDANISDYEPTKPSLWESEDNQKKLIDLWVKIADRYKDAPWVGGYDLINEPNWNVDGAGSLNGCGCINNDAIWDLHLRLTEAIRHIDTKHIIYISGNCWGNNYESLASHPLRNADDNTVITVHKYWNSNNAASIQGWLELREKYNKPLWMSESGENSNHWFAEAIELFESNNIGWSWWPVKKSRLNNVFKVVTDSSYYHLLDSWAPDKTPLSADATYAAVMGYVDVHKTQNCIVARDVIFSMIQTNGSTLTAPYAIHGVGDVVKCVDYDMGKDGFAYHDKVSQNIHEGEKRFTQWNDGNRYRNDGVDIGEHQGQYYVGWTEEDEWLQYTMTIDKAGMYDLDIYSAAKEKPSTIFIKVDGQIVKDGIQLPLTAEDTNWKTTTVKDIQLPKGSVKVVIGFKSGGSNLHTFKLKQP